MWPFRKRRLPPHIGPESVSWQAGDIAECLCSCWQTSSGNDPKAGARYIVSGVAYGVAVDGSARAFGLLLCGCGEDGYDVRVFRKVVPTFEEKRRADRAPGPTREKIGIRA